MAQELAKKRGRRLDDVQDWRPLLRFTQGNPLTLTVLVGQALRDGLRSRVEIEDFVRNLEAGESVFEDEVSEGRTRSLAASLAYGFENAFTEPERKKLALLYVFQEFVAAHVLQQMGNTESEAWIPELKGFIREEWIELLDRAAKIGLLTAHGAGYYRMHPAVPWFFRRNFNQYYSETRATAIAAFVDAISQLGIYYHREYNRGFRELVNVLMAEEPNLLKARDLARSNRWWHRVIGVMQGLQSLYRHTGRISEWSRLVEEIVPDFVDPTTDGPLPGREEEWTIVNYYRIRLAQEARRWVEAARLHSMVVDRSRQMTSQILAVSAQNWTESEKATVRTLALSLEERADIEREQSSAACLENYEEALSLFERIGDTTTTATCAFNLGRAYEELIEIRDYATAEGWYRRSLDLFPKEDRQSRAQCLAQLGTVSYRRFHQGLRTKEPREECLKHLSNAGQSFTEALKVFPPTATRECEIAHNQLGIIYGDAGQVDIAVHHYCESIRCCDEMRDRFRAGQTRYNGARSLGVARRYDQAREWAKAAKRDFEACENADQQVVECLKLLELIESDRQANSPPS